MLQQRNPNSQCVLANNTVGGVPQPKQRFPSVPAQNLPNTKYRDHCVQETGGTLTMKSSLGAKIAASELMWQSRGTNVEFT